MTDQQPPVIYTDVVRSEWIDRNGHLNVGYFMVAFDLATDGWLDYCGLTMEHRRRHNVSTFSVECHATYERELREGDPLQCTTQLLGFTEKKIHTFHRMYHAEEGYLAATNELLSLHMDMSVRRGAPMAPEILDRLEEIQRAQAHLPPPPQVGRVISVDAKPP